MEKELQISVLLGYYFKPNSISQRIFKINLKQSISLFITNKFPILLKYWKEGIAYTKIYKIGQ